MIASMKLFQSHSVEKLQNTFTPRGIMEQNNIVHTYTIHKDE